MVILNTRDSALDMARRGFPVFPLAPGSRLPIEAKKAPKHLRKLAGGINRATTDLETVASWFQIEPALNYGVSAEHFTILDVDVKKGKTGLEDLLALGVMPRTFTVETGTGGMHLYFAAPAGGAGQSSITKSIDVRGVGGYVVGPGSIVDGNRYSIIVDAEVAPVPTQIAPLLGKPGERADRSAKNLVPCGELDAPGSWDQATAWLDKHPPAIEGEGGDLHTYKTVCALKDFGLSPESALDALLLHWNETCVPPWSIEELQTKIDNAYTYGREAPGSSAPALEFEALPEELRKELEAQAPQDAGDAEEPPRFKELDVDFNEAELEARPWIIDRLLLARALTGLVSDPGAGKSTLALGLAICLALGNGDALGLVIHGGPRSVVLVNNEDDEGELQRRVAAFCHEHAIDRAALKGRLIIHAPADDAPFKAFAKHPQTRQLARTKALAALKDAMHASGATVFVIDPFVETHDGDENSNSDVADVMAGYRNVAKTFDAAGLIVHHTRKPPQAPGSSFAGDANVARGAMAFRGNVRQLVTLFPMSTAEAEQYGITGDSRLRYARLDFGKGSYSPAGLHTRWLETIGKTLANGDSAPAVRPVDMTAQAERIAKVLHMSIRAEVLAAGDAGLQLRTAAQRLVSDPMLGGDLDSAAKRLRAVFETPRTFDGVTLVCEPEDYEKQRPRYVLRGHICEGEKQGERA